MNPNKYEYEPKEPVTEIVITGVMVRCNGCGEMVPFGKIGLRYMGAGVVRNQPKCGQCRGKRNPPKWLG